MVVTFFLIILDILKSSFEGGFIKRMDEKSVNMRLGK